MSAKVIALRALSPTDVALSDEALLAACALGDGAALTTLYRRHLSSVRRFVARVLGPLPGNPAPPRPPPPRRRRGGLPRGHRAAAAAKCTRDEMKGSTFDFFHQTLSCKWVRVEASVKACRRKTERV
jgi:hypothetical protein